MLRLRSIALARVEFWKKDSLILEFGRQRREKSQLDIIALSAGED